MTTRSIGRRLLRFAGVLALAGFTVGCASSEQGATVAPSGFGKDPASRAERLVSYCERLAGKGEFVTALGLCARAHEIDPDDPETLMLIASILYDMDRKQSAVQTYVALLDNRPDHLEARYSLAKLYMEAGETSLAVAHLDRAILINPRDPRAYNALGILRDQAGEHQAAQALYRTALKRDPQNHSLRNNLGLSLALSGQREEAIEVLAALAVDPKVDRTVLHNLEAAYASRSLPAEQTDPPADAMAPAAVGAATPAPTDQPVNTEALEPPPGATDRSTSTSEPLVPAAEGAPTPLVLPPPGSAGEPQQTGARQPETRRPEAANRPSSVILAAAEQLMAAPKWADFEPGTLMDAGPPPDKAAAGDLTERSGEIGEVSVDSMNLGAMYQPGEYDFSMLLRDNGLSAA